MPNPFKTEAELCQAFLSCIPKGWVAYPESCNFDIVLAHTETGAQIGIEAKLVLNAKVLCQVIEYRDRVAWGPDFRAVLVGRSVAENAVLAAALGIKVLEVEKRITSYGGRAMTPKGTPPGEWKVKGYDWLPDFDIYRPGNSWWSARGWEDEAPEKRLALPEYVPQVAAGVPAPQKLSPWTIQAIKLCQIVQRLGIVTRFHFEDLKLSPSRWCDGHWLTKGALRGQWVAGPHFPAERFQRAHPISWAQIEADIATWGAKMLAAPKAPEQRSLL